MALPQLRRTIEGLEPAGLRVVPHNRLSIHANLSRCTNFCTCIQALATAVAELQRTIESLEPAGVAGCMEYALMPLLFLVDSTVQTRSKPGVIVCRTGKWASFGSCCECLVVCWLLAGAQWALEPLFIADTMTSELQATKA